jgi:hypothetical protein
MKFLIFYIPNIPDSHVKYYCLNGYKIALREMLYLGRGSPLTRNCFL